MPRISPLPPGGTIGVTAPAGPVNAEGWAQSKQLLEGMGYRVVETASVGSRWGYLAGDDATRAAGVIDVFTRQDVDAIICARGGYGCTRILPLLDWGRIAANPKPFVGYSDVTALHMALWERCRLPTFHGPIAESLHLQSPASLAGLWRSLASPVTGPVANPPGTGQLKTVSGGQAEGRLLGGNLSLLAALAGTPWEPDTRGAILLLEDVGEQPYRLDRMLTQLIQAGLLTRAAGIVLGDFTDCDPEPDKPSLTAAEVLSDRLSGLDVPCLAGLHFGHGTEKLTIPLGVRAQLDATAQTLSVMESPYG